jgi:hypothetical protein
MRRPAGNQVERVRQQIDHRFEGLDRSRGIARQI